MPIHVNWGNEAKTYTIFTFSGNWTWEDYHKAIGQGAELVNEIPYTVNIILDLTNCNLFPSNMLSHFSTSMRQPPKSFDLAVVVTTSGFVQAIANMIGVLSGNKNVKFKVAKTMEEAHKLMRQQDAQKV